MRRREFLKSAGSFLATASSTGLLACASQDSDAPVEDRALFPQGVASGDPGPNSVVLWTRTRPAAGGEPIALELEVAHDDRFSRVVVRMRLEVDGSSDYTARVLVDELEPDTVYHYRFVRDRACSRSGRTWTAPEADADTPIRFAWAACQDYKSGFYGAYRVLLRQDEAASPDAQIRFVLHVGDFIYETRLDSPTALDGELNAVELIDRDGHPRAVPNFEDEAAWFASSLGDYRSLYRTFLGDRDLQDARARWPFVCVWDDHEFSNDAWQTQANYTREDGFDEPSQRRKYASNRAWFEYIPANLAHDFEAADVEDAPYSDPIDPAEPNNTRALQSLTIYRNLRFGRHLDLLVTDSRSYRSDHAIDERITLGKPLIFNPRVGLPLAAVNGFDAGSSANGGDPPEQFAGLTNTRKGSPPGTMLGETQKAWWKRVLRDSNASFKVWGNPVPLLRLRLDTTGVALLQDGDLVLSADAWDGYPSERRELMTFLRDERIANVISLSGDHHAHYAGLVHDDFDSEGSVPVMLDFATAGISSDPQWSEVAGNLEDAVPETLREVVAPVVKLLVYDATRFGGPRAVANLNTLVRYGSAAATVAAETHDRAQIEAARNPAINSHLRYADAAANGLGIATFGADGGRIELVTIPRPVEDAGPEGPEVRGRAIFEFDRLDPGEPVALGEAMLEGARPFPLDVPASV